MSIAASIVFCEKVSLDTSNNQRKNNINNILPILLPVAIPGNYTFTIACAIYGLNLFNDNKIRLTFSSEDGETKYDTGDILAKYNAVNGDFVPSISPAILNVEMWNFEFYSSGIYTAKLYVNEELCAENQIKVAEKKSVIT